MDKKATDMGKLFVEGNRIRNVHTGEYGIITKVLNADMVNVLFNDNIEIPISIDDIVIFNQNETAPPVYKGKIVGQHGVPKNPQKRTQRTFKGTGSGVQLAFEPFHLDDGTVDSYEVYFVNDTQYEVIFEITTFANNVKKATANDIAHPNSALRFSELRFDELNESPAYNVICWGVSTMGEHGEKVEKILKIKAKAFFTKVKNIPAFKIPVHVFEIATKLVVNDDTASKKSDENLQSYTKRTAEQRQKEQVVLAYYEKHKIKELASFSDELDLHIEALTDKHATMTNAAKLELQLRKFEQYLATAYDMGMERVFIIHGVGKGRLKDIIASMLLRQNIVETFKNEYHAKYGFGATEVVFKQK